MKKQHVQKKPNARRKSDTNITSAIGDTRSGNAQLAPKLGENLEQGSSALLRWLTLLGIVGVAVGLAFAAAHVWERGVTASAKKSKSSKRWVPDVWQPRTREEGIVDRFVQLHNAKSQAAFDLLGPAPVFDDKPVSEEEGERRQTDFFLRGNLQFIDIWRGEPDGKGGQRTSPGRYTLITRGNISSPRLLVGNDKYPSQIHEHNPDLIIEVRGGKIHGSRHGSHTGP